MKIVIIGGRGNGSVLRSVILDSRPEIKGLEFLGFLSDTQLDGELEEERLGPISVESIAAFKRDVKFLFALHTVKKSEQRSALVQSLGVPTSRLATIVHPTAWVASSAQVSPGCVVMPLASLGSDAFLGVNTQMYSQSFVGRDTVVGPHVFIANNASVGGRVQIHEGAHIGSNATIRERTTVGAHSVVGAGAVVLRDIPEGEVWAGSPAKCL